MFHEYSLLRYLLNTTLEQVRLVADGIDPEAEVQGRVKAPDSAYTKARRMDLNPWLIPDLLGVRVIVRNEDQCYAVLGSMHAEFVRIESAFRDYIAAPKANGYRSLHTALRTTVGQPVELQVRTRTMHACAEHGTAAHHAYKLESAALAVAAVCHGVL